MKKRINFSFLGLILTSVLLLSLSISIIAHNISKNQEKAAIKDRAVLVADLLDNALGDVDSYFDYANYDPDTARISIIAPDGKVLLDNKVAYAETLENHKDREEFITALEEGEGEIMRYSRTLRADTYYYAIRLKDGNVLRAAKTMSSINGIFAAIFPVITIITIIVIFIANWVARRLTRAILSPLDDINFESENIAVYDELVPYLRKINQQKNEINKQISALKERAYTIEIITSNMNEGLILIDKDGMILIANNSAMEIYNEKDMLKKNILHICRNTEFLQGVKECLVGGNAEILFEQNQKLYNVYFSPANSKEGLSGGIILFVDTTERQKAEKQRREFSANVSHELKTPLTSISALSEMIENGMAKDEDIKAFAAKITEQVKRLIDIINDIIKLSEFDEGKALNETEIFDLYALTETVVESFKENQKDIDNIDINIIGESFNITANSGMIEELLYNLIDNGIKYNLSGGRVTVILSREPAREPTNEPKWCKVIVSDTGIGIPEEHHGRIFERFYRVDKSRSKKTGGTGLGLSIVKHIAEYHGGRIEMESKKGAGTTVTCWLKLP
ncbi:MAG: ATP-binding protein [Lachnospiraceae bacterium]|nr:ATP-binding protein [Lachnospiraceae bacterium]